jgi:hypothetical protein
MKEVWGILEVSSNLWLFSTSHRSTKVVREQCWLNEIISGCQWTTEGLKAEASELPAEIEATEDELQAVLGGSYILPSLHSLYLTPRRQHNA